MRHDELNLHAGDKVCVYRVFEDGYCEGKREGGEDERIGIFPINCLRYTEWEEGEGTLLRAQRDH